MKEILEEINCLDLYILEMAMLPENEGLMRKLIEELEIKEACRRC